MGAPAVAEGLQARAGLGNGDKTDAEGAEPLAEWEQELLASATAEAAAKASEDAPTDGGSTATDTNTTEG